MLNSVVRKKAADALCRLIWEGLTGRKYRRLRSEIELRCYGPDGTLKWEESGPNALVDEGEEYFIKVAISEQLSVPTTFYLGLSQSSESTLGETVTLSSVNEVSGSGYARQGINSDGTDWTVSQDSGDWQAQSKEVTFSASGTWSAALSMFLCTVASGTNGKLIATKDLSQSRTLYNGDQLKARITIKAQ
jgi:hypothetical protein